MEKEGTTFAKLAFSDKLDVFLSRWCVALVKGYARAVVILSIISSVITTLGLFGGGVWWYLFEYGAWNHLMSYSFGFLLIFFAVLLIFILSLIVGAILAAIEIGSALITAGFIYSFARIAENRQTSADAATSAPPKDGDEAPEPGRDAAEQTENTWKHGAEAVKKAWKRGTEAAKKVAKKATEEAAEEAAENSDSDSSSIAIHENVAAEKYRGNQVLKSVFLGTGVNRVQKYAFANCKNLETVVFHHDVKAIGDSAFEGCEKLRYVVFGAGIEKIGTLAFDGCSSLKTVYCYGDKDFLQTINVAAFNGVLEKANVYVYSETKPEEEGNYWHWVDDEPVAW